MAEEMSEVEDLHIMEEGHKIAMQILLTGLKEAQEDRDANNIKIMCLQKQLTKALADKATAISQVRRWQKKWEELRADNAKLVAKYEEQTKSMSMSNADPAKVSNADADEVCNKLQPSQPSHPPPRHLLDGKFLRRTKSKLPTRESSSNGAVKSAKAKMRTRSSSKARPRSSSIVIGQPMQCQVGKVHLPTKKWAAPPVIEQPMQCQIGRIHVATKKKWAAPPVPQSGQ